MLTSTTVEDDVRSALELDPRIPDPAEVAAEIRGIALQILGWDVKVPADSIDVNVQEGWITLKGNVNYPFESDSAFEDVAGLYGVFGITNEIKVSNP